MSYEGFTEFLCTGGHYSGKDCYDDDPFKCPRCGEPIMYRHAVDVTNGAVDDDPSTMPAPKEQIDTEDDWQIDRYGNRYARAVAVYRPLAHWQRHVDRANDGPDATSA